MTDEKTTKTDDINKRPINKELLAKLARKTREESGTEPGHEEKKDPKKGPVSRVRVGRLQLSLWTKKVIVAHADENLRAFSPERETAIDSVCLQSSRYDRKTQKWERSQIWLKPEELRDLGGVMEAFGQEMQKIPHASDLLEVKRWV